MSSIPLPGTFEDALKIAKQALSRNSEIAARGTLETEAEQLVIGAYRQAKQRGKSFGRNDLYMLVMQPFPKEAGTCLIEYLQRRVEGMPLQYILGYQAFLYHEYAVDESVLIPRPETESLVYEIVQTYKREIVQPALGFELGLGSGCISIELLKIFPGLRMVGTETSARASQLARKNADAILGVEAGRLEIVNARSDEIYPESMARSRENAFDFIVSNPPYLADRGETDDDVWSSEPHEALFAPAGDALFFYRGLLENAFRYLKNEGILFFEIPHERTDELHRLASAWGKPEILPDLTGRDRILKMRRRLNG